MSKKAKTPTKPGDIWDDPEWDYLQKRFWAHLRNDTTVDEIAKKIDCHPKWLKENLLEVIWR